MNESKLQDLLPPERPLPPARRREMKERLMATIESEGTVRRVRSRLPVPGAAVAAGVVALAFAAGAVAILWGQEGESVVASDPNDADSIGPAAPSEETTTTAPSVVLPERDRTKPDPEDVAQVMENITQVMMESYSDAFNYHGPGWRPELDAEQMVCALPEGETADYASHFPTEDAITVDHYVQGCTQPERGVTTDGAEVCLMDEDLGKKMFGPDYTGGEYPVPVVALAGRTCADDDLDPLTDEDMAEINRLRAIEASVMATPDCSTVEAAEQWAQAWLDKEGIDFPMFRPDPRANEEGYEPPPDGYEGTPTKQPCFTARMSWKFETAGVDLFG